MNRGIYNEIRLLDHFQVSRTTKQSTSNKHLTSNLAATDTSQGEELLVEGLLQHPPIHASTVDQTSE